MNRRSIRNAALCACLLSALCLAAKARAGGGWSNDAAANLALADRDGDQVQVKLAATGDGGFYVSWYDNAAGGYDMALQRVDAAGTEQWPHNGLVVADTSFSWTMDYGLAVDRDDEALLAFKDDRHGTDRVTLARLSPAGTPLWGGDGLLVDESSDFLGPPKVVSTSDDEVVVAWTHGSDVRVRRLDLAGRPQWDGDVVLADPLGATQYLADLQPTPDGGVIVSWVNTASFYSPRHLYAQRLSAAGQALWGAADEATGGRKPLVVFDSGTLQYGNFPPFVADEAGGAVFAWYETDPVLQVRVQHVRPDGSLRFPTGGQLTAEADATVERVEPAMAYDSATGDIYAIWREMYESGPLDQWLRAQRFDPTDQPAWGPAGLEIVGHGQHEVTQLQALPSDGGGVLFAFVEKLAEGDQRVWLTRLRPDGSSVWPVGRVAVSSVASAKSRLAMAAGSAQPSVLGWQDGRAGNDDIFVQNVNADGSLGTGEARRFVLYLPVGARGGTRTGLEGGPTPPDAG
jgi:hypothetical protein